ncbi:phosphatidate cytidylyltransferase [Agromyces atrinae]|uniref:Phosphatidate cytidylyltransferase n=1 Tax=Agromyces atrinae TaxID=592376 RepID=A0A4Q2M5J1_9MICO|nr:phosphatidate cytidylyltransferase [Agromyces atrinae]MCI2958149.1 phosphatidate cytidylyltransferase [Agromyces atrinae]NYD66548.1 phosphatidate cytidylyltransferase [Agromyces atrinae]RXZ87219.1 phosphatidate cytidylyltransferase [Agromyces atrinae]
MSRLPDGESEHEPGHSARDDLRAHVQAARADIERQFESTRAQFDQAQEKIQERTGRNLILATLIGLVLGFSMLFSLIVVKELFMAFAAVLIVFSTWELTQALRKAAYDVPRIPVLVAAVGTLPLGYYFGPTGLLAGVLGGVVLVAIWRLASQALPGRSDSRGLARDLGAGVFVILYIVCLGGFSVVLTAEDGGQWWTLAFLILAIVADTGAYAAGLSFGKHKMAPIISPKKTWEGFAGGGLACMIAGVLLAIFLLEQEWWHGLVLGIAIFLTATLGDLAESLIKRDLGIKDMSSWLPGHGGFLDRLDSILPSAAVAYAAFLVFT